MKALAEIGWRRATRFGFFTLAMLPYLWRDEPFEFHGKHYRAKAVPRLDPPAPPPPVVHADTRRRRL